MDSTTGIQPVMPVGGMGDGFGGGSFMWIFGLIVLLGLFNGGFGGFGNNGGVATLNADMQRGFDTQNLQAQTSGILNAVTNGTAQTIAASTANATNAINAIKDGNAALIREFGNVETALTALDGNMRNCCCDVKQMVMQSNYDGAMRDAATNANFTAQIQSVKDLIQNNTIQGLRDQVDSLRDQVNMSGVMRFPNQWTYTGGYFPPLQPTAAAAG